MRLLSTTTMVLTALAAGPAAALDFTSIFTVKGRSVYASGPAVDVDSGVRRIGPGPQNFGRSFGGIVDPCEDTPLPACEFGAEAGADVRFNFGLNYAAKFNSGSFDAQYPINVRIDTPADFTNPIGAPLTLRTGFTVPGYTALPVRPGIGIPAVGARLQAKSPTLQAFVDLDAEFNAFVGARACVAGICQGPSLGRFDVDESQTLAAINRNNDGLIRIGSQTVNLNQYFTTLDGNLTARLNIPNIDAVSSLAAGSTATSLRTLGRGNIVSLGANVGNLVGNALGIPLTGNIAGIGYGLLDVSAGIGVDLRQTLSLSLQPIETFNFLTPVRQVFDDGSLSALTRSISIPLGTELTLISSARNLGVVPVTSLVARLSNLTELVIAGDVNIQALRANIYGFDIGPLYDSGSINGGLFSIPIFANSFDVDFGSVTGSPFNIQQALVVANSVPGFRAILELIGDEPNAPGVFRTEIRALDLGCSPFLVCVPEFFANGSPVTPDEQLGFISLSSADAAILAALDPDHLGTDAEQLAALAATGFMTDRIALSAPPGLPRPPGSFVPEPANWALLVAGFGVVGTTLRRRRRAPPAPGRPFDAARRL